MAQKQKGVVLKSTSLLSRFSILHETGVQGLVSKNSIAAYHHAHAILAHNRSKHTSKHVALTTGIHSNVRQIDVSLSQCVKFNFGAFSCLAESTQCHGVIRQIHTIGLLEC